MQPTELYLDRYTPLVQKHIISKQQYDAAVAAAAANQAGVAEAEAESDPRPGYAVRIAHYRQLQAQSSQKMRILLHNRWRSRGPKPIRLQARWIRHVQRWRRRS